MEVDLQPQQFKHLNADSWIKSLIEGKGESIFSGQLENNSQLENA
jgi:hypothetical protein